MKFAIWVTGHPIADTVAYSLQKGFGADAFHVNQIDQVDIEAYDAHFAYGILRGTAGVFRRAKRWFNVDRGFWGAEHFTGTYRLSFCGTQPKYDPDFPCRKANFALELMRKGGEYALICPPTEHVREFFGIKNWQYQCDEPHIIRHKGDPSPIEWDRISRIITFNSSIGWQALQQGITVTSDPLHSVVGSYQATKSIDTWDRNELFSFMLSHQFTLAEIEAGAAWELVEYHLKSSSDGMAGKQLPLT